MSEEEKKGKVPVIYLLPIVLLAISVRIIYWLQAVDEAWFIAPGMDPAFYSTWAADILTGKGGSYLPFPRAPLYPYILAFIQGIFGSVWLVPRLLNLVADVVTVTIIFKFTQKITLNRKIAAFSAGLFAISGAGVYFSGEILMTSLSTAAAAGLIYCLTLCWKKPAISWAIGSGALLAVLSLFRPNALILLPFTTAVIFAGAIRTFPGTKKYLITPIAHFLTVLILLSPVIISNWSVSHRIIPVSSQGGVNFYIGNASGATGWSSELPGIGANWDDSDAIRLAENDAGKSLTSIEVSNRFWQMSWREIKSQPAEWMRLFLKKCLMLFNVREAGNNRPLSLPKATSPMMNILFLISIGSLLPFAVVGIVSNLKDGSVRIILLFIALLGASLLLFFINARYRMPLFPAIAVLAGLGIKQLWEESVKKRIRVRTLLLLTGSAVLSLPGWIGSDFGNPAQAYFIEGNALLRTGDHRKALEKFHRTLDENPLYPELHLNIGVALLATGDTLSAEKEFQQELRINPGCAKAENNSGVIDEMRGQFKRAHQHYQRAFELNRYLDDAWINLGRISMIIGDNYMLEGDFTTAKGHYQEAFELLRDDPHPFYKLALVYIAKGDFGSARRYLDKALEQDPSYKPALDLLKNLP
ncbi:tetratricopeptide repeat protein [bacterium]|nr:tetratricopeptide repeat protein [bacterium]